VSAYQRIISNNSYAHDEQGVNPGRQEGSTVSSISYDHADALINSVKVSAALTWEPKQIDVTESPGWRCRSVNQVAGRWTADRWGWHWISASPSQVLNGGPVRAVAEQVPVRA